MFTERFWGFLAWLEIVQQYRRSALGPFWITLTTAGYIFALILVFTILFDIRSEEYAPWVAIGVISWNFITASLGDAGTILLNRKQLLMHRQLSHNGLVLASVMRWSINLLHQLPIYVGVMIYFQIPLTPYSVLILVTLPALIIILHPICLIIAYASTRLRDIPPLVSAILTPLFFVTPVMWVPTQLGDKAWIADLNPFSAMIALIREPLLGNPVPLPMVLMAVGTGTVLWVVSFAIQVRNSLLKSSVGAAIRKDSRDVVVVTALNDVTFQLRGGDRLALIGNNGSGKSTLLKCLAGIYEPIRGHVEVNGTVAPIFDLSLGTDPELSGYDNILLRGMYAGLSKSVVEAQVDEIAAFSELGDFLHLPIRTYSSGMQLRLAFAVSTAFSADIVLVDEIISVGDAAFVEKSQARMQSRIGADGILVLASHSVEVLRKFCNQGLWLENGEVAGYGDLESVIASYESGVAG
eukprot:s1_g772.t1